MKRACLLLVVLIAAMVLVFSVSAQTSLSLWPYFEKELPARLSKQPMLSGITVEFKSREYKPEPLPLTERVPWLIYLVLAASSIALGVILFSLARTATLLKPQPD